MTKEKINWRTFDDDDESDINRQWNSPATPTFYIIDHTGMIRHQWIGKPGEASVDVALDKLFQQVGKPALRN